MPYDGVLIHFLTNELKENLVGGKINKIFETNALDIVFQIRAKNNDAKIVNHQLFISSSLDMPRIFLTTKKMAALDVPKNFCMVLRKYIERGTILDISQYQNDRLIIITIASTSELGDNHTYRLMIELMGRNSNIILINDENIIIDAIRKLPPSEEVSRLVIPKATYLFPTSNSNINPFELENDLNTDYTILQGISKPLKNAIDNSSLSIKEYLMQKINPTIYKLEKKFDFHVLPLYLEEIAENNFSSISSMLETFYYTYKAIFTDKAKALKKIVKSKITHYETKLSNLEQDLEDAKNNLKYNDLGILLQANLYKIKKGMDKIILEDFNNDFKQVEITLDPLLDPSKNLKRIFSKGKKAKNGLTMINIQIDLTKKEINYLDIIYNQIDFASSIDLDEIKDELVKGKYIKPQKQNKPKNKKINITKYTLNDNEIYVGKNNIQNDYITHKLANSYDWWFHVKDAPGSHVLFKMPNPTYTLTEQDIRYCANLAASFSKYSTSSSVAVDYLQVKYIKKIPGVKGSEVTYSNQKTIYIDPNLK